MIHGKICKRAVVCSARESDAAYQIVIADDGDGLSDVDLEKLIKRGVRLDESTQGHGLGLSIVKEIVDSYEGTIDFTKSGTLGGLQVNISLPR